MAVKNSEVMAQLSESRQCVLKLESELEDKDEILREKFSLMNENRELKVRVASQNERLDLCQHEIESSRVELRSLEKIMSQLPVSTCEKENFTDVLYKRASFCFIFYFFLPVYTLLSISFLSNPYFFLQLPFYYSTFSQALRCHIKEWHRVFLKNSFIEVTFTYHKIHPF